MYWFLTHTHTQKAPTKNANPIPPMTESKINLKAGLFLLENVEGCNVTD